MANFRDLDDALKQLSPAYDVLGDAAHIVDMSGIVVYANAASNLTYGFQRDEFLGKHISVVIPEAAVQITIEMILAMPNHVWKGQVLRQRKNGEPFEAEITVVLLLNDAGRPIGRTAIIRDQSELRRMESEVRSFSAQRSTLAEIGKIVNSSLDINDVYSSIAHEIGRLLPYDRFAITIPHEETGEYSKPFAEGIGLPGVQKGERLPLSGSFTEYLSDHKESINHTESDSGSFPFFEPARKAGLKTMLTVPVMSKGRVVAALYLHSFKENAYSHEDQMLVEQIASQIAGAIVNAQLHDQRTSEAFERSVLADIGRTISSSVNPNQVFPEFAELVGKLVHNDRILITHIDQRAGVGTNSYLAGNPQLWHAEGEVFPLEDTFSQLVAQRRRGVRLTAEEAMNLKSKIASAWVSLEFDLKSFICAPLIANNEVIAVLHVSSKKTDAYDDHDVAIVESIALQIAGAVATARLHDHVKRESEQRALLAEAGRIISSSPDIDTVFDLFADAVKKLLKFDRIAITEYEIESGMAINLFSKGEEVSGRPVRKPFSVGSSFTRDIVGRMTGTIMQGPSISSLTLKYPSMERRVEEGFKSFLFSPLDLRGNMAAMMTVSSFEADAYTEDDLSLAQSIAVQISGAVSNYRLHQELEHESKEREILSEIGRKATSSSDLPEVFEEIARSLNQILQCDRITINIVNLKERKILDSFASGIEGHVNSEAISFESSLAGAVALSNAPILIQADLNGNIKDDYSALSFVRKIGLQSTMAVPLRIDDKVIGVLKVHSKKPSAYSSRDLYLVERIGNQIAGPIANARSNADLERTGNAARQMQARFESILDIAEDSIISLDNQGHIILFNSGAQKTFGYSAEEVFGKSVDVLMPERFRADHHGNIEHFKNSDDTSRVMGERTLSIYGLRKNGEEFQAEASISKLVDEEETIVTVILRDTTDRLELERQLLQSQKLEAVGTLAGGIAHDFNNMLSAILSYTHLATIDLEQGRSITVHLEEIKKAGERSADLTRQLLGFSRQQIFNPEVANLNSIISEIETLLARTIGENIIIETRLDPELENVFVDRSQISQVLMNMAVNSRDAMPNGGTLILETANIYVDNHAAGLQPELKIGSYATFKVTDQGDGIPEEILTHVFEPFYTSKATGKGTGLGLSMCHGIIAQSGGHIDVRSEKGKGTTFTVYLPTINELVEKTARQADKSPIPNGKESILLVEDEPIVRRVATTILSNQGYEVEEATNGKIALEVLSAHPADHFDILITDVVMPVMGGRELVEKFKETHPRTSVLYMSGYTNDDMLLQDIHDDKDAMIQKPFTPTTLAEKVREILDSR